MFFNDIGNLARLLIVLGLSIAFIGVMMLLAAKYFPWLGHLPGDINIERENLRIYFPLATMLLVSVLATLLLNIVIRFFGSGGE